MLLALAVGLGFVYLLARFLGQTSDERFVRQLADSGQQAADGVVRSENDLLRLERQIANTDGVGEAAANGDAEGLRALVLPLILNAQADMVAILDLQGTSLLAIRHKPGGAAGEYDSLRGEAFYAAWPAVNAVLRGEVDAQGGDKHPGLESLRFGDQAIGVFFIGGPLKDTSGRLLGAILVGQYLPDLVATLREAAGAHTTVYDAVSGRLLSTSLEPEDPAALTIPPASLAAAFDPVSTGNPLRSIDVSGSDYTEVLLPLTARQGNTTLGVLGVSLLHAPTQAAQSRDVTMVIAFGALALVVVVIVGLLISNSITRPLVAIADASARVALGNLDTHVAATGNDEIGVLGRTFNQMVETLRSGTSGPASVPPEPPTPGPVLAGLRVRAAVLFADASGLAAFGQQDDATLLVNAIGQYSSAISAILSRHGGVVTQLEGAGVMAFFGVLPRLLPTPVSALQAVHAGLECLEFSRRFNKERGGTLPPMTLGVGVSLGEVIAGSLGEAAGRSYTVIGEPVAVAQRLETIAGDMEDGGVLIAESTYRLLGGAQPQFIFGRYGRAQVAGQEQDFGIYELRGRSTRLLAPEVPGTPTEASS
jgi:class 3 adenylate cyclase